MPRFAGFAAAILILAVAMPAAAQDPVQAPDESKLICKKTLEVGSLVRKRKQCMTKEDWDKVAASQQAGARKMMDELSGRCGQDGGYCQ